MSLTLNVLRTGFPQGLRSLLRLSRFVLPTVFLLTLLQHSPLFPLLATWFAPLTLPLGLPGEAALLLLTGLLVNKFAGIAGLLLLPLSPAQFFTAALFLSLAHNLILELLIVWQSRLPLFRLALLRTGTAYLAALLAHALLAWTGWLSQDPLQPVLHASNAAAHSVWWLATSQALNALWMLALFLLPLFLLLELLRQLNLMERLNHLCAPLTRSLRLPPSLTPALLAGLLLGVSTGAGVIEQVVQEQQPERRDLYRLNVFLLLFHSVIEDTLMFALFPIPLLFLACTRFLVAWLACRLLP